ncbi:MAG: YceK/YidQ family lipoprotein [Deltaproteobacteria bacterium]|nr:MAG: YceK/YidQ family lipoprotein [Deltaproteobacteria bacterium]
MLVRAILCAALAFGALGCQTTRSWVQGCPDVYSGVRYYADQFGWLPFDGKVFFTIDLPLSLAADTLSLPVTLFVSPSEPAHGYAIGCRWAARR